MPCGEGLINIEHHEITHGVRKKKSDWTRVRNKWAIQVRRIHDQVAGWSIMGIRNQKGSPNYRKERRLWYINIIH